METEKGIVEDVKIGKATAFDKLYELYSSKLYYFALSILKSGEDAEEVVQTTFMKIWEKRLTIDAKYAFKSFIFKVAYNVIVDILRERLKEQKYREVILNKAAVNYNLEESIEYGDLIGYVQQIVQELPPRKKEIFQLSREKHLTYNEISEKLDISVKTVENSINYSLKFIKSRLGNDSLVVMLYIALFL